MIRVHNFIVFSCILNDDVSSIMIMYYVPKTQCTFRGKLSGCDVLRGPVNHDQNLDLHLQSYFLVSCNPVSVFPLVTDLPMIVEGGLSLF